MSDERAAGDAVYCFFDTNILLHFQTFDEVEWPKVLGALSVCLMVAPIVFRELSAHKDDARTERRQTRARDILPKLEEMLPDDAALAGEVRAGVTIREIPREPRAAWDERGLEPQVHDDRLIATILDYKDEHPAADVCLITDDVPLRRKAKHHGIRVVDPNGKLDRLPFAASAVEIENQKLKQELQVLKHRAPELVFGFLEDGRLTTKVERPHSTPREGAPSDEHIAEELAQLQTEHEAIVARARGTIDGREVEEYIRKYREYLLQLALAKKMQRSREYGPRCRLTFTLTNGGGAAAHDVDLEVAFPDGSFVVGAEDVDKDDRDEVRMPSSPVAKWTMRPSWLVPYSVDLAAGLALYPKANSSPPARTRRGPLYDFDGDRGFIWFKDPKLPQDSEWVMPTVIAYLPPDGKRGFPIKYTLRADELPKAVTGTLHVVWNRQVRDGGG